MYEQGKKKYTKEAGNYISRKETVSRSSDKVCTTEKIDRGMTVEKNNWLEGLKDIEGGIYDMNYWWLKHFLENEKFRNGCQYLHYFKVSLK